MAAQANSLRTVLVGLVQCSGFLRMKSMKRHQPRGSRAIASQPRHRLQSMMRQKIREPLSYPLRVIFPKGVLLVEATYTAFCVATVMLMERSSTMVVGGSGTKPCKLVTICKWSWAVKPSRLRAI